MQLILQSTLSC